MDIILKRISEVTEINYEELLETYIYKKIEKCSFIKKKNNKPCNKEVKNGKYCDIHNKLASIYDNYENKNQDIDNFNLTHIKDDYYVDIFDNVLEIKNNIGDFVGLLIDNEIQFMEEKKNKIEK